MISVIGFIGCTRSDEPIQPSAPLAEENVHPRVLRFLSMLENRDQNDGVMDLDSAEWYIEAALNFSMGEAWLEYETTATDSLIIPLNYSGPLSMDEVSSMYMAFNQYFQSIHLEGENHLILADVMHTSNGSEHSMKTFFHLGSGYQKTINANYGPSDYWGSYGSSTTCGCGINQGATGICAERRIAYRMNATANALPTPPCYYTSVEAKGVNAALAGLGSVSVDYTSFDFPTGIPATPYSIYLCEGYNCPTCFTPGMMSFYTQEGWDVMQWMKPTGKVFTAAQYGVGFVFANPPAEMHAARFTYAKITCPR